jgi:hypothetical protein
MEKHVTLKQSEDGWTATVATAQKKGENLVAMGESLVYSNKDKAWSTIVKDVQAIDFEEDTVIFNRKTVESFEDIEKEVKAL